MHVATLYMIDLGWKFSAVIVIVAVLAAFAVSAENRIGR